MINGQIAFRRRQLWGYVLQNRVFDVTVLKLRCPHQKYLSGIMRHTNIMQDKNGGKTIRRNKNVFSTESVRAKSSENNKKKLTCIYKSTYQMSNIAQMHLTHPSLVVKYLNLQKEVPSRLQYPHCLLPSVTEYFHPYLAD